MTLLAEMSGLVLILVFGVCFAAGFVKGAIGFAMPMIMISGLGSLIAPELALAALILPTVFANVVQAFRQGIGAAWDSAKRFWLYLSLVAIFILFSAQLVSSLSSAVLYFLIGIPVTLFALSQLMGWILKIAPAHQRRAEILIGSFAGFCGGISGVWGPPTVAYLTALNTPKQEAVRVQGVIYGIGAIVLLLAHIRSGVFNSETALFSALMLLPAGIGLVAGMWVQDRMDQARFRKATLLVLTVAGVNLIRRGVVAL